MRTIILAVIASLIFIVPISPCCAQKGKAVKTIVKVLTGIGAAESVRRSGQSLEEYKQEDAILTSLQSQGIDANKSSIFSVYFRTTGGTWADFWSNPDLFFIVDIEGQGSKLVPQIHYNYRGEPVLDVIVSETVRPGSRIVVRVIDDDTSSDAIWNNILKTRANLSVTPEVQATKFVSVRANANGQIALLDRSVTLDAPDFVASAEFIVPQTDDGLWVAEANLIDGSQIDVGSLQFASLWSAQKQLNEQKGKVATSFGKFLFWGVIGLCLLTWFGWNVISQKQTPPKPKEGT
jgi:hypothetical protein